MRPPSLRLVIAALAGTGALVIFAVGGMAATAGGSTVGAPEVASPTWGETPAGSHVAFRDGPPARVTGGFGEDSCFACHWNGTENDGVGSLQVSGFPEKYEPGARYDLTISLAHPEMVVAGFQLAVRYGDGETQAGALEIPEEEDDRISVLVERDVEFAQHRLPGIEPSGRESTRWSLRWAAPADSGGRTVHLHISAVAGDGDESQMGDHVYTLELDSRPAEGLRGVGGRHSQVTDSLRSPATSSRPS